MRSPLQVRAQEAQAERERRRTDDLARRVAIQSKIGQMVDDMPRPEFVDPGSLQLWMENAAVAQAALETIARQEAW